MLQPRRSRPHRRTTSARHLVSRLRPRPRSSLLTLPQPGRHLSPRWCRAHCRRRGRLLLQLLTRPRWPHQAQRRCRQRCPRLCRRRHQRRCPHGAQRHYRHRCLLIPQHTCLRQCRHQRHRLCQHSSGSQLAQTAGTSVVMSEDRVPGADRMGAAAETVAGWRRRRAVKASIGPTTIGRISALSRRGLMHR